MDAKSPLCIELEIGKVLRWEDKKSEALDSTLKVPVSDLRIEIEPSGVKMVEDMGPSDVGTALVACNRVRC